MLPGQYGDFGCLERTLRVDGGGLEDSCYPNPRNKESPIWTESVPIYEPSLTAAELEKLRQLDTCSASNAIERLGVRMRNEGFVRGTVRCQFPQMAPMVGYAATAVIRSSNAPMSGRCYYDRMDWWQYLATVPEPRVMVFQDVDPSPGLGAFVGEIHASIALALHCIGCVTNGSVRDIDRVQKLGFHLFAGSVSVSHAYAHIVEFGEPVEIGGLKIRPGDLIHGDRQGVLTIPISVAATVPDMAARIGETEKHLIEFCRSDAFSLPALAKMIEITATDSELQTGGTKSL